MIWVILGLFFGLVIGDIIKFRSLCLIMIYQRMVSGMHLYLWFFSRSLFFSLHTLTRTHTRDTTHVSFCTWIYSIIQRISSCMPHKNIYLAHPKSKYQDSYLFFPLAVEWAHPIRNQIHILHNMYRAQKLCFLKSVHIIYQPNQDTFDWKGTRIGQA